jgi:probable HAF family extracellular repeat protein
LSPIIGDDQPALGVTDLNNRGQLAGVEGEIEVRHAFRWADGRYMDIHDLVAPGYEFSEATGMNDFGVIVGARSGSGRFHGFRLSGTQVSPISVREGETFVFPVDINNRGEMIVDSFGGGPGSGSFFVRQDGTAEPLPALPTGSERMLAIDLNDRGAVVGHAIVQSGTVAVLWQNGLLTEVAAALDAGTSTAYDVNNRTQVVGAAQIPGSGDRAFIWQNGTATLLPAPTPPETTLTSAALNINDWGAIVGEVLVSEPDNRRFATLWINGHPILLENLISDDDPLKPFVRLESAFKINNRGEIAAFGTDSRTPEQRINYLLRFQLR